MMSQDALGESFLDVTFLIGSGSKISAVIGRRNLTQQVLSLVISNCAFLTYDNVDDALLNTSQSNMYYSKEYNQRHRRNMANLDTIPILQKAFVADGIVDNGFTSNINNAKGTGNEQVWGQGSPDNWENMMALNAPRSSRRNLGSGSFPPREVPSLANTFLNRLIPRHGNYCGPGWTAGKDTFSEEVIPSPDGTYLVAPVDEEDAICKRHDEAYGRAKNDPRKVYLADEEMVNDLKSLSLDKGLSNYGASAKLAIQLKMAKARLDGTNLRTYEEL